MKHITPPVNNRQQHQPLTRNGQKSVEIVDADSQMSPPSAASGAAEVCSLDGATSLDSTATVNVNATSDNDCELQSSILDGDNVLVSAPNATIEEDQDSVSEDFVMTDDGNSLQNCSDSPSNLQFNDDGNVLSAPETIAVMWQRMLSCLGDINQIQDVDIHLNCLEVLSRIVDMLLKIRDNQGVPIDGTPQIVYPPALVPPYTVFIPWMLKVLNLSERYHKSKMVAIHLLCRLVVRRHDVPLEENLKAKFAMVLHSILTSGDDELTLALFRACGAKIFYMPFTESSAEFLLLDYIRTLSTLLNTKLTSGNRLILIHFASCAVNLPTILNVKHFSTIQSTVIDPQASGDNTAAPYELQKQIVDCLLKTASSAAANHHGPPLVAQALKGIALFVHSTLLRNSSIRTDEVLLECMKTLLSALTLNPSTNCEVGLCVCQLLSCLLYVLPGAESDVFRQHLYGKVIETMNDALVFYLRHGFTMVNNSGQTMPSASPLAQQNFVLRLLFDLTEWCLHMPRQNNIHGKSSDTLTILETTLQTLISVGHNKNIPLYCKHVSESLVSLLLHFYNQQLSHPCSVCEFDKDESGVAASGDDAYLYLKYHKNCTLSMCASNSNDCSVKLLMRQTSGKDCVESKRLRNFFTRSSTDINQWLSTAAASNVDTKQCLSHSPVKKRSTTKKIWFPDNNQLALPCADNADGATLERMLAFLEKTSPECFSSFTSTNGTGPDGGRIEQVAAAIDQLHLSSRIHQANEVLAEVSSKMSPNNFDSLGDCHIFLDSSLNPIWENRSNFNLLEKSDHLQRELKHVDNVLTREVHKIAVIYISEGEEDKQSILKHTCGSKNFESFVAGLGYEIDLKKHAGYCGGLPCDGTTAYWSTPTSEVLFHISTRSMGDANDWTKKLRHIGNDEVHIVWSEHWRDYRKNIIPTDFCDILIVVYPLANHLFRIQIEKNADIPDFGPLFDGALVDWCTLASLVRCTAINASRAKRSAVEGYKNSLEHRYESLAHTVDRLKVPSTYSNLLRSLWMVGTDKKHGQRV